MERGYVGPSRQTVTGVVRKVPFRTLQKDRSMLDSHVAAMS